jgi:hypothetical protein
MSDQNSPTPVEAPSGSQLLKETIATVVVAVVLLVLVVLPAEYDIDITGFGAATGLDRLGGEPTETIVITDIIGGNETLREVEIPMFGEPAPLPNPAVFQKQDAAAQSFTMTVELGAFEQTEIKTVLGEGKVILYSWRVLGDERVYVDFHGHDESFGPDFFVRYEEMQEGTGSTGSLVAPFEGEHGWFWLNINETPITIELEVSGFYDNVIDYGIF